MKKSYLCGLALLAPALLLTGCGGGTSSLSISANWYSNTGLSDSISGTDEHLEYAVSFRGSDITNTFKMEYEGGTYTVDLKSERRELSDGTTELVYVLTSALSVSGKYTLNGASSAPFTDTVECETVFHNARAQLKPVRSSKLFKSTVPNAQTPASLENACTEYHYTFVTEYANDLKSFKTIYTDLTQETPTPTEESHEIKSEGTYLDNEEILFALRGLDLASSNVFYSFNPAKHAVEALSTGTAESEELPMKNLALNGADAADINIPCYKITLGYNGVNPGNPQTLWYARTTSPTNNTYRNVLTYMEVPVMYNLGTLCYTLKAATFATK